MSAQEVAINTLPFWSRFVLEADLRYDGTNLFRRIFAQGFSFRAYDYRQGATDARALRGQGATERDTILTKGTETRGGGVVHIRGISVTRDGSPYEVIVPGSGQMLEAQGQQDLTSNIMFPGSSWPAGNDSFGPQTPNVEDVRGMGTFFNEMFLQNFKMDLKVDGSKRTLEMGPSMLHPGINGPTGNVYSSNGAQYVTNYTYIPEGITWNPAGAVDSNMTIALECAYDVFSPTYTSPAGTANGEAPSPENLPIAAARPTALGRKWRQGWVVNFHGMEESPTSDVS